VSWKVTVRRGSQVGRERLETLDEAIAEARRRIDEVRREGGLPAVSAFRDYAPDQQVHARIEISGPGLIRSPEGGVDIMGDGSLVAYTGTIRKRAIAAHSIDDAFERLAEALR
jgi:transposase